MIITKAATDAIERVRADYVPAAFEGSDATVLVFTDAFGMPTEICAVCEFRYG